MDPALLQHRSGALPALHRCLLPLAPVRGPMQPSSRPSRGLRSGESWGYAWGSCPPGAVWGCLTQLEEAPADTGFHIWDRGVPAPTRARPSEVPHGRPAVVERRPLALVQWREGRRP